MAVGNRRHVGAAVACRGKDPSAGHWRRGLAENLLSRQWLVVSSMSHHLAQEKRKEYEDRFGEAYDPLLFPSPDMTPEDRKVLVANIKVYDALARQEDIDLELQQLPKAGDVVILDDEHSHLPVASEHEAELIRIWSPFTKSDL